jgi:sortase A
VLQSGATIWLTDPEDLSYRYSVSDLSTVWPEDVRVVDTLVGRDMLTLQTCIPPTFEDRLIVRANRT